MSPMPSSFFNKLLLLAIIFPTHIFSTSYPWWSLYPNCAWPSLDAAVPATCANAVGLAVTECLCTSSDFLSNAAKGVGAACGCSILDTTASTAASICQLYGYPIAMDQSQFIAAGQSCSNNVVSNTAVSTASNPTTNTLLNTLSTTMNTIASTAANNLASNTVVSTPTPSSTGGGNSGGLSPGLTAAVSVVGLVVAVISMIIGYLSYRRMQSKKNDKGSTSTKTPLMVGTKPAFQVDVRPMPSIV